MYSSPRDARRLGLEGGVQDVHAGVVERAADGRYGGQRVAGAEDAAGGEGGGLGGAVAVHDSQSGAGVQHPAYDRASTASPPVHTSRAPRRQPGSSWASRPEQPGGQPRQVTPCSVTGAPDLGGVRPAGGASTAVPPRSSEHPHLVGGRVEACGECTRTVVPARPGQGEGGDVPLAHGDALGGAGVEPRGEHQVLDVVGVDGGGSGSRAAVRRPRRCRRRAGRRRRAAPAARSPPSQRRVSRRPAPASVSMRRGRSAGARPSSGTYTPPVRTSASCATISCAERSMSTPTEGVPDAPRARPGAPPAARRVRRVRGR